MKKEPSKRYEKETGGKPFVGTMSCESQLRQQQYIKEGCNAFETSRPTSKPISFWTEKDIWAYIKLKQLPYSSIYDMGYTRTGCMFCCFGVHLETSPNRFQRMERTHPKQWNYCINKLGLKEALDLINVPYKYQPDLFDEKKKEE